MQTKNCSICNKVLLQRQKSFCSPQCKHVGVGLGLRGRSSWNTGRTKEEFPQLSNSGVPKGTVSWNKGRKLSEAHKKALRKKKPMSEEAKLRIRNQYRSGQRRVWNKIGDGITPIHEKIRKSPEYKEWRSKVFARDNFTCNGCGKHGGFLHADHIQPFSLYPTLRFDVGNGRTLCVPCHRKTETYGKNPRTGRGWNSKNTNAS